MYQAEQIADGRYIIADREYGYTLCRLDFSLELMERLPGETLQQLANQVKSLIVDRLKLEDKKNDDPSI